MPTIRPSGIMSNVRGAAGLATPNPRGTATGLVKVKLGAVFTETAMSRPGAGTKNSPDRGGDKRERGQETSAQVRRSGQALHDLRKEDVEPVAARDDKTKREAEGAICWRGYFP